MDPRELQNKRVLIVGYGVTGASVARFLAAQGITFDVADECDDETARTLAVSLGCQVHTRFEFALFSEYAVLVLSPGVARATPSVAQALAAGIDVIGDIELFAGVVDAPVIAVTGSNGKSSVVTWIVHVLQRAGIKALACGNIGQPALDCLSEKADVFVLELSSYQLESTRSLRPLAATVLNISEDHMDRYTDIEHYASVKRSIYQGAANCVANHDDKRTWPEDGGRHCDFFTLDTKPQNEARWHRTVKEGAVWLCDDRFALMPQAGLSVPGDHNAANALAVLALIESLAIPFTALQSGLSNFTGLAHRTEFLGESGGVRWYNDSKGTNVDACIKAIRAMPGPVVLIAGGISKDADFSPMRSVLEQHVRVMVLIGRDRDRMASQLEGSTTIVTAESLRDAVTVCREQACNGDAVLLSPACSSFDMFRNFEDRGAQFAAVVEEMLAA